MEIRRIIKAPRVTPHDQNILADEYDRHAKIHGFAKLDRSCPMCYKNALGYFRHIYKDGETEH